MKIAKYPQLYGGDTCTIGVGAHTDTGFLTLVAQNAVEGLQIEQGGEWVQVCAARLNLCRNNYVCAPGSFNGE